MKYIENFKISDLDNLLANREIARTLCGSEICGSKKSTCGGNTIANNELNDEHHKELSDMLHDGLQNELHKDFYFIIDSNLKEYFKYFSNYKLLKIDALEENKSLSTVEKIDRWLMEQGAAKSSVIVGVGGGIITDITGFVAATYMRGIRGIFIPTTLLAQCDASIGGKNGVNLDGIKNLIGTISFNVEILILCPEFLNTLSMRILREGMAEILKTFLVTDSALYEKVVETFKKIVDNERVFNKERFQDSENITYGDILSRMKPTVREDIEKKMSEIIAACQKRKMEIVEGDKYDRGIRHILNFGHTFGHAIEYCSKGKLLHGEAVAIGIVMALKKSVKEGICKEEIAKKIENDFRELQLPVSDGNFNIDSINFAIMRDKKNRGEKIQFVLLQEIGKPLIKELNLNTLAK